MPARGHRVGHPRHHGHDEHAAPAAGRPHGAAGHGRVRGHPGGRPADPPRAVQPPDQQAPAARPARAVLRDRRAPGLPGPGAHPARRGDGRGCPGRCGRGRRRVDRDLPAPLVRQRGARTARRGDRALPPPGHPGLGVQRDRAPDQGVLAGQHDRRERLRGQRHGPLPRPPGGPAARTRRGGVAPRDGLQRRAHDGGHGPDSAGRPGRVGSRGRRERGGPGGGGARHPGCDLVRHGRDHGQGGSDPRRRGADPVRVRGGSGPGIGDRGGHGERLPRAGVDRRPDRGRRRGRERGLDRFRRPPPASARGAPAPIRGRPATGAAAWSPR